MSNQTRIVCLNVALLSIIATSSGCHMAATGQNMQGVRLYERGQYQAALQRFQQAVASNAQDPDTYYNMAATLHRMGTQQNNDELREQAETLYHQCLDLNEDHTECHRGLAVLLAETGRSDRAFNLMKNWANRSPENPQARIELARLYEEFGDKETATVHLQEALKQDPHAARAWRALARLREESGDAVQALANYQRSFNLNTFQPDVAKRIAALNHSVTSGGGFSTNGDTRLVNPNLPSPRY